MSVFLFYVFGQVQERAEISVYLDDIRLGCLYLIFSYVFVDLFRVNDERYNGIRFVDFFRYGCVSLLLSVITLGYSVRIW